jgi:hypothetical protein
VAFDPDVTAVSVGPVTIDPVGVGVGWLYIDSGNPDVGMAVPAVVASVPGPIWMLVWGRRDDFVRALGWSDTDDNLGLCNACGEKQCAGNSGEEFLHRAISL